MNYSSLLSLTGGDSEPKESHISWTSSHFPRCTGSHLPCVGHLKACKLLQGTGTGIPAPFNVPANLALGGHLREVPSLAVRPLAPQSSSSGQCMPGFSKGSSPTLDRALCFQVDASTFLPSSTCWQWHSSAPLGRDPPPGRLAHLYFKLASDTHFDTTVPPLSFPHYLALFRACFFLPLPKHNDCYN